MKFYAVKNDEGKWLGCEIYCDEPDWFDHGGFIWDARSIAEENVKLYGGHVVELAEAPAKIVVSEDEAEMLTEAKTATYPAEYITRHSCLKQGSEDRLMRAYVIGWTVEKPKRYFVRVPHANRHYYYQKCDSGEVIPVWDMETEPPTQFTAAEIEHYGLQDCEKVVVTDYAKTTGEEDYD